MHESLTCACDGTMTLGIIVLWLCSGIEEIDLLSMSLSVLNHEPGVRRLFSPCGRPLLRLYNSPSVLARLALYVNSMGHVFGEDCRLPWVLDSLECRVFSVSS